MCLPCVWGLLSSAPHPLSFLFLCSWYASSFTSESSRADVSARFWRCLRAPDHAVCLTHLFFLFSLVFPGVYSSLHTVLSLSYIITQGVATEVLLTTVWLVLPSPSKAMCKILLPTPPRQPYGNPHRSLHAYMPLACFHWAAAKGSWEGESGFPFKRPYLYYLSWKWPRFSSCLPLLAPERWVSWRVPGRRCHIFRLCLHPALLFLSACSSECLL